ncbi:phytanoyl-CoA dioxygenase domain-containing protein 1-like [Littorina saxatilis]|uniref:Phytanoyl-CoA dioxygenase n=1 Tax=Littorina saxatilis TaxID=31220 RepID=A0AAN9BEY2_9CAEN
MSPSKTYSGHSEEAHPEIYTEVAMPEQPTVKKPGQLSEDKIRQFFEKGWVLVEDFFTPEELEPVRKATERLVDIVAQRLYKAGKISSLHEDLGLFQRLTVLEKESPGASVLVHKLGFLPPEYKALLSHERLVNVLEQVLGPRVAASPVWNIRTKTPNCINGEIPWHQDSGYFAPDSYKTLIPVAWVPLLDATPENGCLQYLEGGHRRGVVCDHLNCWEDTWHVMLDESKIEETLGVSKERDLRTVPVKYGGFLLFNNLIPHRSLENKSNDVRWSLDLRWQRPGEPEGLFGIQQPVLLRDPDKPDLQVDWAPFEDSRHVKQAEYLTEKDREKDELDSTISGPWMKQWRIVHGNKHTKAAGLEEEGPER